MLLVKSKKSCLKNDFLILIRKKIEHARIKIRGEKIAVTLKTKLNTPLRLQNIIIERLQKIICNILLLIFNFY